MSHKRQQEFDGRPKTEEEEGSTSNDSKRRKVPCFGK